MHVRRLVLLSRIKGSSIESLAILSAIESFARAILSTVIPLQALALLGDAQRVSLFFFSISIVSLCGTLTVPWLIRHVRRRWIYSLGGCLIILSSALMAYGSLGGLAAGMVVRVFGVVALTVCLNLYIMDHIARRDLIRSEPKRLFYSAAGWSLGPVVGVWLGTAVAPSAPYLLSIACAITLLGFFWMLRLGENTFAPSRTAQPNPLRYIRRYFAQPRLVLAWSLAIGRNVWWVMFFIYTPIYTVTTGLGALVGGLAVSIGTGFLFLMPLFGWSARRFGLRRIFIAGFLCSGATTLAVALLTGDPLLGVALLICAALGMTAIDAGGNILFLRAAHPGERPEITTVYGTYRDVADLVTPGVFAILLKVFPFASVFAATGATMFGFAYVSRWINRRL